jgi:hypothetical protein
MSSDFLIKYVSLPVFYSGLAIMVILIIFNEIIANYKNWFE